MTNYDDHSETRRETTTAAAYGEHGGGPFRPEGASRRHEPEPEADRSSVDDSADDDSRHDADDTGDQRALLRLGANGF